MKLLVDRIALRNALQRVEPAVSSKPTHPVYGGVWLEADNDRLVLMANDLDLAVRDSIEQVQVERPGWVVVPGRELVDVVRDLEADTVTLEVQDGGKVELVAGEDRCVLLPIEVGTGLTESTFPSLPALEGDADFVVDKEDFLLMVQSTRFATSRTQDPRFATEGVLLDMGDGELVLVGTDGRRLACIRRPLRRAKDGDRRKVVLLPKALDHVLRCGHDEEAEEIEVFFLDNQVGFRIGGLETFGRVLEGTYPNYAQVIPEGGKHVAKAPREALSRKLRLASHLTLDTAAEVKLAFAPNDLEVASEHQGRGRASAHLEVDYAGTGVAASFNPKYLMEGLKAAHGEHVEIQLSDPARPARFVLGEGYDYVVMPLNTPTK